MVEEIFNKPNRRKLKRLLSHLHTKTKSLLNSNGVEGYYVLVNKIRPNEGGANAEEESRFRDITQVIVLGSSPEAKTTFCANMNPRTTDHAKMYYASDVPAFMKRLMKDSDPANDDDEGALRTEVPKTIQTRNQLQHELQKAKVEIRRLKKLIADAPDEP